MTKKPMQVTINEKFKNLTKVEDVDSSIISRFGYDADAEILVVEFTKTNEHYAYLDVEEEVFQEMIKAESQGSFFSKEIKDEYDYILVSE